MLKFQHLMDTRVRHGTAWVPPGQGRRKCQNLENLIQQFWKLSNWRPLSALSERLSLSRGYSKMQFPAKKQQYLDCVRIRVHARVYMCPSAPVRVYVCVRGGGGLCVCRRGLSCMCACESLKESEMKTQEGSSRWTLLFHREETEAPEQHLYL